VHPALDAVRPSGRSRQGPGDRPEVSSVGGGSVLVPRSRGGCTALCAARSLKLNWLCSGPGGFFAAPCSFPSGDAASSPADAAASLPSMAACASCLLAASACGMLWYLHRQRDTGQGCTAA